ncbi:MAG: RNA polymerase sigma factor [Planctomycetota bacterium]
MPRPPSTHRPSPEAARAVAGLAEQEGPRLHALARRLCGKPDEAEDLVQEVFLAALKGWDGFEGRAAPTTWLYTIAARACQRMHRKRAGQPQHVLSLDVPLPFGAGDLPTLGAHEGGPPSEQVQREALERMQAGIVALPVTFRLPFVLKEVVGLSVADVARVLGLKPATVKTRLHRARLRVRQELEKSMEAREVPAAAYERQVCLDLLAAKQEALDRGTDLAQPIVCERCREVFASLDFAHDACRRLGDEAMPPDVKSRLLAAIAKAAA